MTETAVTEPEVPQETRDERKEKALALIERAQAALAERDYSRAVESLDHIPESLLDDATRELRERSIRLRSCQRQFETARRQIDAGKPEQAVIVLEQIPESDRGEEFRSLHREAELMSRVLPALERAEAQLRDDDLAGVVETLSAFDDANRTDPLRKMLAGAEEKLARLETLRTRMADGIAAGERAGSAEEFREAMTCADELLLLHPRDADATSSRELALRRIEELKVRDEQYAAAVKRYAERDDRGVIELLERIDEFWRRDDIVAMLDECRERVRRIEEIGEQIRTAFDECRFADVESLLDDLGEIEAKPERHLAAAIAPAKFAKGLASLAEHSVENAELQPLLDRFVNAWTPEEFVDFFGKHGTALAERHSRDVGALGGRLRALFDTLPDDPEKLETRLQALRIGRDHLGEAAARLDAWDRFLAALAGFDECARQDCNWKKTILETPELAALDVATEELAQATADVLPDEATRYDSFLRLAGERANVTHRPGRKSLRKVERFLQTAKWDRRSLAWLGRLTLGRSGAVAAAVTASVGVLWLLSSVIANFDGAAGITLATFLTVIWSTLAVQLHELV